MASGFIAGSFVCRCREASARSPEQTGKIRERRSRCAHLPAISDRTGRPGCLRSLRGRSPAASTGPGRGGLAGAGYGPILILCNLDGRHRFLRSWSCGVDFRSGRNLPERTIQAPRLRRDLAIRKGTQVIPNGELAKVVCRPCSVAVIEIVFDLRVCPSTYQEFHHVKVPILRRHVQRGYALAVREAAEGGFAIDGCSVIEETLGCFPAIAYRCPNQRRPPIWIRIHARPCSNQAGQHFGAAALGSPYKSLVQNFLRIGG